MKYDQRLSIFWLNPLTLSEKIPKSFPQAVIPCSEPHYPFEFTSLSPSLLHSQAVFLRLAQYPPTLGIYLSDSFTWDVLLPNIYGPTLYPLSDHNATSLEKPFGTPQYKRASLIVTCFLILFSLRCLSQPDNITYSCVCFLSPMTRNKLYPPQIFVWLCFIFSVKECLGYSIYSAFVE